MDLWSAGNGRSAVIAVTIEQNLRRDTTSSAQSNPLPSFQNGTTLRDFSRRNIQISHWDRCYNPAQEPDIRFPSSRMLAAERSSHVFTIGFVEDYPFWLHPTDDSVCDISHCPERSITAQYCWRDSHLPHAGSLVEERLFFRAGSPAGRWSTPQDLQMQLWHSFLCH